MMTRVRYVLAAAVLLAAVIFAAGCGRRPAMKSQGNNHRKLE